MRRRTLALLCLCLLLCTSCTTNSNANVQATPDVNQPGSNLPSPTIQTLPGLLQTEQVLLMTPHPTRDLFSLAQRFKGYRPSGHVAQSVPLNEQVGHEQNFWIENQDTSAYQKIRARLVYLTDHAYVYIEDGQAFNQAALQASADIFEKQIYPTDRAQFGDEWMPGVDGDRHITILNAVGLGQNRGGVFSERDEYPSSVSPYSNQREMFYMSLDSEIPGSPGYNATVANEFQRVIGWHQQALTPNWFNEGLAVLAQRLNAYSASGVDAAFLRNADTQLTDWPDTLNLNAAHVGASYLFMDYFAEHYGGYGVLKEILQDPATPPTNFDDVLAKHNYTDHFIDVVGKWMAANAIANSSIDVGEYGYPNIHLAGVLPQQRISAYPAHEADQVHQYAAEYYDLHPSGNNRGTLKIHLSGSPTVRLVGNDPLGSADEWWGNRADNLDSTLTRSLDLSSLRGQHATLQFAAWFDLEQAHDYAYVEVSSDGGARWVTLPGSTTTKDNPSGLNLGNGYTSTSGGEVTPVWVQESVDLSAYAGKKIQIRFEEVTDGTVHLQGFALDQIRIPELHFQDDISTDNGWISAGFIRSNNVLPEHYLVQAIVYNGTHVSVQAMTVDLATAQGTLTVPQFGNQVSRVVLIVAAYAPETTLQAHYQLEISQ
jgi:immune inhibitor A